MPGPQGLRIETIYAFVAVDPSDNNEGIIGMKGAEGWIPLIGADLTAVEQLRHHALTTAATTGHEVRLVHFTRRLDLEVLTPPKAHSSE